MQSSPATVPERGPAERSSPLEPPLARRAAAPRESDPEFAALPAAVQDLIREGWRDEALRDLKVNSLAQRDRKLALAQAVLLLAPMHWMFQGFALVHLALGIALGVVVGAAWVRLCRGLVATTIVTGAAFFAMELLFLKRQPFWILGMLFATALVARSAAYLGLRREMRHDE